MSDKYQIDGHKMHLHPLRVVQWMEAGDNWDALKKVYPIYVEISPNGACNHRCSFCAVDYIGYKPRHLAADVLSRCVDAMAAKGVKSVMYAGEGEPLLAPGVGAVINRTKAAGVDVAVTTNATPLTPKMSEECLGSVTWLKASINGGDSKTYSLVHKTKEADFERVLGNLAAAVRIRQANRWTVTLGAQIVLLPENSASVVALAERASAIGLDYLVVKPYSQHPSSSDTAARYQTLTYSDYQWLSDRVKAFNRPGFSVIMRDDTMKHLTEHGRYYQRCESTPFFWAYIMATGDVYGCSAYLLDDKFCYGNINEQSFSDVWEGERRRDSVLHVRNKLNIDECRKNCRMENVNRYLWDLTHPDQHRNFI